MGKSIFPLRPELEDTQFIDPDTRFNSLPYSSEIPEPYINSFKVPPFSLQFLKYLTCREKIVTVSTYGFCFGWVLLGHIQAKARYGNALTRWRVFWCSVIGGVVGAGLGCFGVAMSDLNCSTFTAGRRRTMFYEESVRHSMNAKFGLYENLNKIMMSKERITRQEFFEAFEKTTHDHLGYKEF